MHKLCTAVKTTGTTHCIISKTDVLDEVGIFKLFYKNKECSFDTIANMKLFINKVSPTKLRKNDNNENNDKEQ